VSTDLRNQLQSTLGSAYTLERELGGGGMSRVFVAEESALRRKVVVKLLPPELTAGVNVDRLKREILVAAQLQHPHIVPVLLRVSRTIPNCSQRWPRCAKSSLGCSGPNAGEEDTRDAGPPHGGGLHSPRRATSRRT
jgi:hypothetical protein